MTTFIRKIVIGGVGGLLLSTWISFLSVDAAAAGRIDDQKRDRVAKYVFVTQEQMKVKSETAIEDSLLKLRSREVQQRRSLGRAGIQSIGSEVTPTFDDWQYSNKGRHVDFRGSPDIYFSYGHSLPVSAPEGEEMLFGVAHFPGIDFCADLQVFPDTGYWPNLDVQSSASWVAAGWEIKGGVRDNQVYWSTFGPVVPCISGSSRIPASVYNEDLLSTSSTMIHPVVEIQDWAGETYTHVVAFESNYNDYGGLSQKVMRYFRKTGSSESGLWDVDVTIDTIPYHNGHLTASRTNSNVAVIYTKYKKPQAYDNLQPLDRDVWIAESNAFGIPDSWEKMNITEYSRDDASYTAWLEVHGLYDMAGELHAIWNARATSDDVYDDLTFNWSTLNSSLFHWKGTVNSLLPGGTISRITSAEIVNQSICGIAGYNMMHLGGFSISECNGKMYVVWSQSVDLSDPRNPVTDDCASDAAFSYAANTDIWLSVSNSTEGILWDEPRNLTDTYTPACNETNGDCLHNTKASMSRYGMDESLYASQSWPSGVTVDPTPPGDPTYTGDHYLHMTYLEDQYPGTGVFGQGPLTENSLRWVRLACADPVPAAVLVSSVKNLIHTFLEPATIPHGTEREVQLQIGNDGNTDLLISSVVIQEDTGPSGWLLSSLPTVIQPGEAGYQPASITLNAGQQVDESPNAVNLVGRLIIHSNSITTPDTIPVDAYVTDPIDQSVPRVWDTLSTGCLALTAANNGNIGRRGAYNLSSENITQLGHVSMDYADFGDCDPYADIYIWGGSSIVCRTVDAQVKVFHVYAADDYLSQHDFVQLEQPSPAEVFSGFEIFQSGRFVTSDNQVALEKFWFAPSSTDTCNIIIQLTRVVSNNGQAQTGLTIGEALDWDVPADSSLQNSSAYDSFRNLIYQTGAEYDEDPSECQENNARHAGLALLQMSVNGQPLNFTGGAFTTELQGPVMDVEVNPVSIFYPADLFSEMQVSGFRSYTGSPTDIVSIFTYVSNFDLGATDTLEIYSVLTTVQNGPATQVGENVDKARQWLNNHLMLTTPVGEDVVIDLDAGVDVTFKNVTDDGVTTLTVERGGPPPPDGLWIYFSEPPIYYIIETTAGYDGLVEVCIDYNPGEISFGKEKDLVLYHYVDGAWVELPSTVYVGRNMICGTTSSLSPFIIASSACCTNLTGNVDNDPADLVDLGDLTSLIDYLFISFTEPACIEEANVDGDVEGLVDLGDLTALIDYLFISFTPPAECL